MCTTSLLHLSNRATLLLIAIVPVFVYSYVFMVTVSNDYTIFGYVKCR